MGYSTVAKTNDIENGGRKLVTVDGEPVILFKIQDNWYAIGAICPHNPKNSMAEGTLEGTVITCPADGTQFELTTGKNIRGVKSLFGLKAVKGLRQYNIQLEGNSVRIQCL